jgi:hypothetical protein
MFGKLKGFNVEHWLKSGGSRQFYERLGYLLVMVSVALVIVGMILGSFLKYTIYMAFLGALLLLPAILFYIASQLMEVRHETAAAKPAESAPRAEHARQ